MSTKIKIRRSLTPAEEPSPSSLGEGELAVNIADQKLWVGDASGNPTVLVGEGGGEANTASCPAAIGTDITMPKVGTDLRFKRIKAGDGITLTSSPESDQVIINATASSAGEANTSSNLGSGTGLAAPKVGADLPFKSLVGGTNVTLSSTANTVTINASTGSSGGAIVGEIRAWNSSFGGTLPAGWFLCDGTNGTPDYRGKQLFAAGSGFTDGTTGGALPASKTTGTAGTHTHSVAFTSGVGSRDHYHSMNKITVQSGTGAVAAAWLNNAGPIMSDQGNDHTHSIIGGSSSTGNHSHSVPAPDLAPYAVVTGYIIYLGT